MNSSEHEIEKLLRSAPEMKPPRGLKEQLVAEVRLPRPPSGLSPVPGSWLGRWWPVLASGAACLVCASVLALQQSEIKELKRVIEVLSQPPVAAEPAPVAQATTQSRPVERADAEQELVRLKGTVKQLRGEIAQLEQVRGQNDNFRTQLAAGPMQVMTPEEQDMMNKAREQAQNIQCINNLKQIALAARIWAGDNNDINPPDILSMTNELNTPKILACPADPGHPAVNNWAAYSAANCSYEYLAPSSNDQEPDRVLFRCPIHGNIAQCDSSVIGSVAKTHPENFVQQNGALYYRPGRSNQ